MTEIHFSYNWNNKLDCKAFTTIRLKNPKYCIGETYKISLKKEYLFDAQIINIKTFKLENLNDFIAYLDTGYDLEKCKEIILKMYPKVDFEVREIYFILLKKMEIPKTNN